jgi:hypothetical protein
MRMFGKAEIIRSYVINEYRFKKKVDKWQFLEINVLIAYMLGQHLNILRRNNMNILNTLNKLQGF